MKSTRKIILLIAVIGMFSGMLMAQGSNPPPPIPPPPPGTPIDDWIPFVLLIGLIYGARKVFKSNERLA